MDFEQRNVTTILNVIQFSIECKRSDCSCCFPSLFLFAVMSFLFLLFILGQFENSMRRLNQQINEKFYSSFLMDRNWDSANGVLFPIKVPFFNIILFFFWKNNINLWIVYFDYSAADFASLDRFWFLIQSNQNEWIDCSSNNYFPNRIRFIISNQIQFRHFLRSSFTLRITHYAYLNMSIEFNRWLFI